MVIIDAVALSDYRNDRGRLRPQDQIQILKRLAAFVEREQLAITAVFQGRALREAADGSMYRGVRVKFTGDAHQIEDLIKQLARRSPSAVVVTANRQIEQSLAGSANRLMRSSTFKKALDPSSGRGRHRPSTRRRSATAPAPTAKTPTSDDGLMDLIDPL